MELPPAADVGWYELGPSPGQPGSAVLAAHVDYGGQRGAFFDLRSVAPGAEVLVEGDGTSRRFIVSGREQVAKDAVRLERYFTAQGPARITLITCGGVFDRGVGHYRDNVILTADLAP
jgi:sortase (surface protein transpeptidase)